MSVSGEYGILKKYFVMRTIMRWSMTKQYLLCVIGTVLVKLGKDVKLSLR